MSAYVYNDMVDNIEDDIRFKFLMYPRFLQLIIDDLLPNIPRGGNLLPLVHHSAATFSGCKRRFNPPKYTGTLVPIFDSMRNPALPRPVVPEVQVKQAVKDVEMDPIDLNIAAVGDQYDEDMEDVDYEVGESDSEDEEVLKGLVTETESEGEAQVGEDLHEGEPIIVEIEGDNEEKLIGEPDREVAEVVSSENKGDAGDAAGSPSAFNIHGNSPPLEVDPHGTLQFSPPGSHAALAASSSSINISEPYIPQLCANERHSLTLDDVDVDIDFEFEMEIEDLMQRMYLSFLMMSLFKSQSFHMPATEIPASSYTSIGVQFLSEYWMYLMILMMPLTMLT